jgi:predicted phage tail protein
MIIRGAGGGGKGGGDVSRAPQEAPDTLLSDQYATVVDLVSEGEIDGLVAGLRSVFLDDVPIQNADGTYNFSDVTFDYRNGTQGQTPIGFISGTESENSVGIEVKQATPIEKTVSNAEVDRVRVTVSVLALTEQDTGTGDLNGASVTYKISVNAAGTGFVDADLSHSWSPFGGSNTPSPVTNFRAAIRWDINYIKIGGKPAPTSRVVRLEYRVLGSGSAWSSAGDITLNAQFMRDPDDLSVTRWPKNLVTSLIEVYGVATAVYELRATSVSTTEPSPGALTLEQQAVGQSNPLVVMAGKTTSKYQRSHIIGLKAFGSPPYIIRVTRVTPDSAKTTLQNRTFWESYTEIIDERLNYPNSALMALRVSSKQFGAIPRRAYHIRGLKVKVPANYDPITRVYSGAWNGTFKVAWTNNPAWIYYDLCTSSRYGVGDYVPASMIDKWSLYTISQYCDALVPDGYGGLEPRYTCNLFIQTRDEAYRALANISSIFRGIIFWSAGAIVTAADMPSSPVYQFTNANVVDGVFVYTGTSQKARHNVALVTWNDPADMYKSKVEYISDDESIAQFGVVNQIEVYATGCTSRGQARRVGGWIIYTEKFEGETVTFNVGLDGNIPRPGDIVNIADSLRSGSRTGGRLAAGSTSTAIVLDAQTTIAAGIYTLSLINPSGALETRTVTNGSGVATTINVSAAFSFTPAQGTVWLLSVSTLVPQTFRIIGISEADTGNEFTITAVKSYAGKYDYVEQDRDFVLPDITNRPNLNLAAPAPTGISSSESLELTGGGAITAKVTVSWEAIPVEYGITSYVFRYRVGESRNWVNYPPQIDLTAEISNALEGETHYISVQGINAIGVRSRTALLTIVVQGKNTPPSDVTGFYVTRSSSQLGFSWNHIPDLDRDHYEIRLGGSWESATPVGATSSNVYNLDSPRGGTFLIKAVDTTGHFSAGAAAVLVSDVNTINEVIAYDEGIGDWNGTKTYCIYLGTSSPATWEDVPAWSTFTSWDLIASIGGLAMTPPVSAGAWASLGGSWNSYVDPWLFVIALPSDATATYLSETVDIGYKTTCKITLSSNLQAIVKPVRWADMTLEWEKYSLPDWNWLGLTAGSVTISYQIQFSDDNITWSPLQNYAIGSYTGRYFRFFVTLATDNPIKLPYLTSMIAVYDVPDRALHFEDVVVSTSGVTVAFNPPFVDLRTVQVTLQSAVASDLFKVTNKTVSGVTINVYDSAGVAKAGVIDVDVFGYGEKY